VPSTVATVDRPATSSAVVEAVTHTGSSDVAGGPGGRGPRENMTERAIYSPFTLSRRMLAHNRTLCVRAALPAAALADGLDVRGPERDAKEERKREAERRGRRGEGPCERDSRSDSPSGDSPFPPIFLLQGAESESEASAVAPRKVSAGWRWKGCSSGRASPRGVKGGRGEEPSRAALADQARPDCCALRPLVAGAAAELFSGI